LIVIAYLKTSRDKGKGKAPSNPVEGFEDEIVPDSEAGLGYDGHVAYQGDSDSVCEASEFEIDSQDELDEEITLRNKRKLPPKRSSRVPVRDYCDRPEEEEEIMVNAAIEASIRNISYGDASTSAGSVVPTRAALAAAAAEFRLAVEQGLRVDSEVVSDNDFGEEEFVLTDSEDEHIVQKVQSNLGRRRGTNQGKGKPEYGSDRSHLVSAFARREARRLSRLEKQDMKMLESRLGRRLTYVGLTNISLV
jgi:hypothetical protein